MMIRDGCPIPAFTVVRFVPNYTGIKLTLEHTLSAKYRNKIIFLVPEQEEKKDAKRKGKGGGKVSTP